MGNKWKKVFNVESQYTYVYTHINKLHLWIGHITLCTTYPLTTEYHLYLYSECGFAGFTLYKTKLLNQFKPIWWGDLRDPIVYIINAKINIWAEYAAGQSLII